MARAVPGETSKATTLRDAAIKGMGRCITAKQGTTEFSYITVLQLMDQPDAIVGKLTLSEFESLLRKEIPSLADKAIDFGRLRTVHQRLAKEAVALISDFEAECTGGQGRRSRKLGN
jgi:hypothetical protein